MKFHFKPAKLEQRALIHQWLTTPHAAEWFYGEGLQSTFNHLDQFFHSKTIFQYWVAYEHDHPFALLITTSIGDNDVHLKKWCKEKGKAITLDILIGDPNYLGKGYAATIIQEFLLSQFPNVAEVLIDPEASNSRAVHVYQKAGFTLLDRFIPKHSPAMHYMMSLSMKKLHESAKR